MRYLLDVWLKPWIELSAIDRMTMAIEAIGVLFLFAIFKVYVIDSLTKKRS